MLFRAPGRDVTTDREIRGEVERLAAALQATRRTQRVTTYYGSNDESLVSPDKDSTILTIAMGSDAEEGIEDVIEVVQQADRGPYEVSITGEFTADNDLLELSNKDLKEGELFFGLPAALIVLLVVFGAVVASLVPVLLAIVSIVFALALVAIVGQIWEVSFFVVNMLTGMGLALGVDYALFIVSRFREERARGVEKIEAIADDGADGQPRRPVQRDGLRDRADRDAARAGHDPAQPRGRRGARRDHGRARGDDAAARGALAARRQGRRLAAAIRRARQVGRGPLLGRGRHPRATAPGRQPRRHERDPARARPAGSRPPHRLGGRADDSGRLRVEGRLQRARAGARRRHGRLGADRRRG